MVKKLFKHEFLALGRFFVPVYSIFVVMSILGRVLQFFESETVVYGVISVFSVIVYAVSIFAVLLLTTIFCIVRYYKHLFSSEGYLSFTLPVTPTQHIMVKLITAVCFQLFSLILIVISLGIITSGETLTEVIKAGVYLLSIGQEYLGIHLWLYGIELLLLLILASGCGILLYYTCITVGQMARKNRILVAVGVYFGYYIFTQIMSTVLTVVATFVIDDEFMNKVAELINAHIKGVIHGAFGFMAIFTVVLGAVYFIVIRLIIKNKLNLE